MNNKVWWSHKGKADFFQSKKEANEQHLLT